MTPTTEWSWQRPALTREEELAQVREINAHLPFADPIAQGSLEIEYDSMDSIMTRVRHFYGNIIGPRTGPLVYVGTGA